MTSPLLPAELLVSTSALFLLVTFCMYTMSMRSKNPLRPTEWPIVGILPSLVVNLHRLHDYATDALACCGHNFKSCLTGMRFLLTCDPTNIRHIFTSNHANYLKGVEFSEMFDVTDGSFFTVDGEPCRRQRARIQSIFSSPRLLALMAECCRDKVEKGVTPLLARMAKTAAPFDMHDLLTRFAFDVTATPIFGVDPGLLSTSSAGSAGMHAVVAMDTVMEVGLFRHTLPMCCWKAMRWLNVGPERKLAAAHKVLRGFVAEMIERRKLMTDGYAGVLESHASSVEIIMSTYINDPEYSDDLLCATLINFMIAGRDTIGTALVWLFYNLAKNPDVVACIRKELAPIASRKAAAAATTMVTFEPDEMKPLVYMHAVLYESLRLFPPIPIERKTVIADDELPSGHVVRAGDTILVSLYSLGRMQDVWGEDCMEYRPERWLSGKAGDGLRYVPTHKFLAFNSGPRMCLGKDIAIMQMKTAVAAIVWNFDVEVLEGQSVHPKFSCILQMKNGLMMKVKKREM
ncbi:alkane hydroxylase MAH1-like [Lolium rigidum]|uniref:alkane hydroxylase MAH1-like n=1 Tax=Lolium rigidum TaxID=89674 RepID=UPI001F5D587C|nr:alkane hydroxylase MAH1-like [Lolium rigidum]